MGSGAPFEARSWGEVGSWLPTSILYKPKVFGKLGRFRIGKCWRIENPKPFLCREAIEESNFVGHFWELRSSIFSAFSCVGFLISRRTQPYQFVIHLALLWCTFEALMVNKKASPTETKAQRRRRYCRTPLIIFLLWFSDSLCSFLDLYILLWLPC